MVRPRPLSVTIGNTEVVVDSAREPPFEVEAEVIEDDTYFVLGADTEVREPTEHPIRIWTELHETEPAELGSIRVIDGRPLRLHAVVHDLSTDPTVKPDSVSTALTEILRLATERGIRSLGLPVLGAVHGKLPAEIFVRALLGGLRAGPPARLERIRLSCGIDEAVVLRRLLETET